MTSRKKKKASGRIKLLVLGLVVFAVALSGFAAFFILKHQAEAVVDDRTAQTQEHIPQETRKDSTSPGDPDTGDSDAEEEAVAILSSSVRVFDGESAAQLNQAIQAIRGGEEGIVITLDRQVPEQFETLGSGDIFLLEGSAGTPFGDTFIGKVESVDLQSSQRVVTVTNPSIDEVFDQLRFDLLEDLTRDNLVSIDAVEGVQLVEVDTLPDYFSSTSASGDDLQIQHLSLGNSSRNLQARPLKAGAKENPLLFEIDIDFLEIFGLSDLAEVGGGSFVDANFRLKGEAGLKDIVFDAIVDWDVSDGLTDLSFGVNGTLIALMDLNIKADFARMEGQRTAFDIGPIVKMQGLREKRFPFLILSYSVGTGFSARTGGDSFRRTVGISPLTVALMFYVDMAGQLSVELDAHYKYENQFRAEAVFVRDGKLGFDSSFHSDPKTEWWVKAKLTADNDIHVGGSVLLYVFNLNILDVALVKFGAEIQGAVYFQMGVPELPTAEVVEDAPPDDDTGEEGDEDRDQGDENGNEDASPGFDLRYGGYARIYLKFVDIKLNFAMKIDLWVTGFDFALVWNYVLSDITLWEIGTARDTSYNPTTMTYGSITAKDPGHIYYKDLNGDLVKESGGFKEVLLPAKTLEIFGICGIDQSYLYVLTKGDSATYAIYRVSIKDGTHRQIADSVDRNLAMDRSYLYYADGFSPSTIMRIDRETLATDSFASLGLDVVYMNTSASLYYVVTAQKETALSWLMGRKSYYYLYDQDGKLVADYGGDPDVPDLPKFTYKNYYNAVKIVDQTPLITYADGVYWLSLDQQSWYEITSDTGGYATSEAGVFTVREETGGDGGTSYTVRLLSESGDPGIKAFTIEHATAVQTIRKDGNGFWYYVDESDTELLIYKVRPDFSGREVIKRYALSEVSFDLSNCRIEILDNRLFFYTMPDATTSSVLYRCNFY